jgi:hypothetical protein
VAVQVVPVHDRSRSAFDLQRLGSTEVFEGIQKTASQVYAYDLAVIQWADGSADTRAGIPIRSGPRPGRRPTCISSARAAT